MEFLLQCTLYPYLHLSVSHFSTCVSVFFKLHHGVQQGVSRVQSRKCSKRWWNVHSCNHAWMCDYLTTVQVNLGPQSLVLCVGAKAHKPSALWSACQLWNLRPLEKPPPDATALAPLGSKKKYLKVNQRGVFFPTYFFCNFNCTLYLSFH